MVVNRPAYLSSHRPSSAERCVRGTLLLAGNVNEALGPGTCRVTAVAHVNPGGAADSAALAAAVRALCLRGPPRFLRRLEAAARK